MLMVAWIVISMFIIVCLILAFVVWAFNEHITARKYRHLVRLAKAQQTITPSSPSWTVTFKIGGKTETRVVSAITEEEALLVVAKSGVSYDKIISSVRSA